MSERANREANDALGRWLGAELSDRDLEAEAALAALFRQLPAWDPPAGFAERVLLRAGVIPLEHGERAWAALGRLGRWTAASALVLAGLAVAFLPTLLALFGERLSLRPAIEAVAAVVLGGAQALAGALNFWEASAAAAAVFGDLASRPAILVAVAAGLALAAVTLRLLHGMLISDRSPRHAHDGP